MVPFYFIFLFAVVVIVQIGYSLLFPHWDFVFMYSHLEWLAWLMINARERGKFPSDIMIMSVSMYLQSTDPLLQTPGVQSG